MIARALVVLHRRSIVLLIARLLLVLVPMGVFTPIMAELSLRVFWAPANNYFVWTPGWSATFEPSSEWMPGVDGQSLFRINSIGLRGPEPGPNRSREYRILAIGGSTTECLYLDQEAAWPELLGTTLRETHDGRTVWAGNGGRSGFNARDHWAFTKLALAQHDVDVLLVLAGVNDLQVKLLYGDAYDTNFVRRRGFWPWAVGRLASSPWYREPDGAPVTGRAWLEPRALDRLKIQVQRYFSPHDEEDILDREGRGYEIRRERRRRAKIETALPSLDSAIAEYARNLRLIIESAQLQGVRVVLLTQPSIWRAEVTTGESRYLWAGKGTNARFYYSYGALAQGMDAYNAQLLAVCAEMAVECIDLAAVIPKSFEAFYDDMHFNTNGSRLVANHIAEYLSQRPPFAPSAAGQPLSGG